MKRTVDDIWIYGKRDRLCGGIERVSLGCTVDNAIMGNGVNLYPRDAKRYLGIDMRKIRTPKRYRMTVELKEVAK